MLVYCKFKLFNNFSILQGVVYPALHNLVSRWSPPAEKGKFISCLLGGALGKMKAQKYFFLILLILFDNLGTVITWPASGLIIEKWGWEVAFYSCSVFTFIIAIAWYLLVFASPGEHPRISIIERDYIEKSLGGNISMNKLILPIKNILSSIPFYALV